MTSKLKCPFCQTELEDAGIHSAELYFCCTNCYMKQKEKDDNYTASPRIWQALIQYQQQLKLLEPIVASLQGRADINSEVARDSNELVVQWYEKYEQSQKDLEIARQALKSAQDHNNRMLKVLGEEVAEESTDDEECCWIENCSLKQELKQALEQIGHKE